MKKELVTMFKKSTLIAGLVTVLLIGTTCYLWAVGRIVPPELIGFDVSIVSYWLHSKLTNQSNEG